MSCNFKSQSNLLLPKIKLKIWWYHLFSSISNNKSILLLSSSFDQFKSISPMGKSRHRKFKAFASSCSYKGKWWNHACCLFFEMLMTSYLMTWQSGSSWLLRTLLCMAKQSSIQILTLLFISFVILSAFIYLANIYFLLKEGDFETLTLWGAVVVIKWNTVDDCLMFLPGTYVFSITVTLLVELA